MKTGCSVCLHAFSDFFPKRCVAEMMGLNDAVYNFRTKRKVSRHKAGVAAWSVGQGEVCLSPVTQGMLRAIIAPL